MIIIPAIDLKDNKCVRLRQGIMDDDTVFSDNPTLMAEKWQLQGAKRLHLVDLNGAFQGKPVNLNSIKEITQSFPELEIQVGGGIRDIDIANQYFDIGVNYLIIGTKAVTHPEFVTELCKEFPEKIIIGLDATNGYVATDGWAKKTNIKVIELAKKFEQDGVLSIIYTDIQKDGMMQGVNIETTKDLLMKTSIPVIASGGITDINDIINLKKIAKFGLIGAITGRAIYEGKLDFIEAQKIAN